MSVKYNYQIIMYNKADLLRYSSRRLNLINTILNIKFLILDTQDLNAKMF